jgi:hypothetical protein
LVDSEVGEAGGVSFANAEQQISLEAHNVVALMDQEIITINPQLGGIVSHLHEMPAIGLEEDMVLKLQPRIAQLALGLVDSKIEIRIEADIAMAGEAVYAHPFLGLPGEPQHYPAP